MRQWANSREPLGLGGDSIIRAPQQAVCQVKPVFPVGFFPTTSVLAELRPEDWIERTLLVFHGKHPTMSTGRSSDVATLDSD